MDIQQFIDLTIEKYIKIVHIMLKKLKSHFFKHSLFLFLHFKILFESFWEEYILENKFWSHEKSLEDSKCSETEGAKNTHTHTYSIQSLICFLFFNKALGKSL